MTFTYWLHDYCSFVKMCGDLCAIIPWRASCHVKIWYILLLLRSLITQPLFLYCIAGDKGSFRRKRVDQVCNFVSHFLILRVRFLKFNGLKYIFWQHISGEIQTTRFQTYCDKFWKHTRGDGLSVDQTVLHWGLSTLVSQSSFCCSVKINLKREGG